MIQIIDADRQNQRLSIRANNQILHVKILSSFVLITLENSSHKTWRGVGKMFESFDQAEKHYKSPSLKEAIKVAEQCLL